MTKGFVIAATGSGSGKTTLSLGLMAWLSKNGYRVAPFKVGPDFIDPGHHAVITGHNSYNLDSWMLPRSYNQWIFKTHSRDKDVAVVEGVMGLFDGFDAVSETGSTAQMAKWLGLGVVLVVDAKGMARSAAAMVKGFEAFDPELDLAGVIFSKVGSARHYDYLKTAVETTCKTPCLGYLPGNDKIQMEERHLGLVTAMENPLGDSFKNEVTAMVDQHVDVQRLLDSLDALPCDTHKNTKEMPGMITGLVNPSGPKIAVAKDNAFCFYYKDNLECLEKAGARIVEFSPLTDTRLPAGISGIYLGGGYPELYTKTLSENNGLLKEIKDASDSHLPIYAECGGFMYLCHTLTDKRDGVAYPMAGCFPFKVETGQHLRSLGYREITLNRDTILGTENQVLRGHEFHYSSIVSGAQEDNGVQDVFKVTGRTGQDISLKGFRVRQTLGTYFHVHFGSNPHAAVQFVSTCRDFLSLSS